MAHRKQRTQYCPLALCLQESGYPRARVYGSDEDITLNGVSAAHTKQTRKFIEEFDAWVNGNHPTTYNIPKPRTIRLTVKEK